MSISTDRRELLDHALAYAEAGWPVFPLRPNSKRPAIPNHTAANCDQSDRRCADGHTGWEPRATLDTDRIQRAWQHRPYGIGIACGPAGLLVIDLDTPKTPDQPGGAETLAKIEHRHGHTLPATWSIGTPSGGRHLYYRQPETGQPLGNTAGKLGPGIDTRGHGGYVVAPPSRTPEGEYWLVDDHEPAHLPHWFSQLLNPQPTRPIEATRPARPGHVTWSDRARGYVNRAINGELDRIATAAVGQRNHTLFCASIAIGQLVAADALNQHEGEGLLLDAAHQHVSAGAYTRHQAQQTITSGLARGLTEPRQLPANLTTGANA